MTIPGSKDRLATTIPSYQTETVVIDGQEPPYGEDTPLIKSNEDDFADPVYRDVGWAILFWAHVAVMIWLGVAYGSFGSNNIDESNWKEDINDDEVLKEMEEFAEEAEAYIEVYPQRMLTRIIIPCALLAYCFAYVGTAFVIPTCPTAVVQSALLGSLGWMVAISLLASITSRTILSFVLSAGMVAIVVYYIKSVWPLIPFAAVNLKVSLEGISANWGMYLLALLFSVASFVWTIFWLYVTIGVMGYEMTQPKSGEPTEEMDDVYTDDASEYVEEGPQGFILFLLLVSLYWTSTVLMNTVQVTVAGVMGTWCFDKLDAASCCSPAVISSLYRSVTYSFGSICFGSLMQALMTALRVLVENARNQRDNDSCEGGGAIVLCILECIVRLLEDVVEYFNQWAYVFVGIYGYSYLESGRKVMELMRARGFTAIISNQLVSYVLGFVTFTVAVMTGFSAMAINAIATKRHTMEEGELSYIFGPLPGSHFWAFGAGMIVGIAVSAAMVNVIKGAVNTLIVCYADAPAKLDDNHPQATREITESWSSVFPDAGIRPAPFNAVV